MKLGLTDWSERHGCLSLERTVFEAWRPFSGVCPYPAGYPWLGGG